MRTVPARPTDTQHSSGIVARLVDVTKIFPGFALFDMSIDVRAGEAHVIVGENGSGKSSMMKLLAGWFPPDAGKVFVRDNQVGFRSMHEGQSAGVFYLHQDVQTCENLSVAENVFLGRLPTGRFSILFDRPRMIRECGAVFQRLGIDFAVETPVASLGYAERQLVAAVRAFVSDSEIVIFDEPTSAMNDGEREILFRIVDELKRDGRAIFYISHRLDEIRRVGDRVTVIHKGRIVTTEACDRIDHEALVKMMTAEVRSDRYPRLEQTVGPTVLSVRNLTKDPILKGVSFDLRRGEILGITGLMGSGRTLLASCLFGLAKPVGGSIEINGRAVEINTPWDAMAAGISLIPEDRVENGIFRRHNLVHNVTTATLNRFLRRFFLDERYMEELTLEYAEELTIKPGNPGDVMETYSGGNQQKVLVARWLMNRSHIYIMDEPTRGIDVAARVDIYNAMNDLTTKGAAVILISSEIEEILGMSNRVLVLEGGRIAAEFPWRDASKERILEYATGDR